MKSRLSVTGLVCCSIALATPALALDPACQSLMQSQRSMANIPVHITLTETETWSNRLSKAAASMGVEGTKKSEEISTGKDVYVMHDGKWIDMQTSFAGMASPGDLDNDPDIKKAREAERCTVLPDETVAGQTAAVYQAHNRQSGIDTKIWISKSTHLPLKSVITNRAGGPAMSSFTVSTYDYSNVRAPVGAISMKQMVDERRR
ncbi:MAG TPA: hypothetical protein VKR31_12595 [Rhizomicrobium sp.]|nr:hypothetical protein [Rhizomicrobium sp.]